MFVSATLETEYVLIPGSKEFRPFFRVFDGLVSHAEQGYTLSAYDQVPTFQVKGAEYFGKVAEITRTYGNRQAFLTGLQLTPSIGKGESIVDGSKGLRMPTGFNITANVTGMVFNQVPQLLQLYQGDKVLTGFSGNYDFKSELFKGQANFVRYADLWKA